MSDESVGSNWRRDYLMDGGVTNQLIQGDAMNPLMSRGVLTWRDAFI